MAGCSLKIVAFYYSILFGRVGIGRPVQRKVHGLHHEALHESS